MTDDTTAAQSATVDDAALIKRAALALASGNVGDAKYRHDDAVDVHEQVYGPLLAAKDTEIQRLRAELADITKTAWEDRESRIKEADQLRAELERERNPNVELSLANQSAFSASLAAVQARYADGFKLQRDEARAELAALRAKQSHAVAAELGHIIGERGDLHWDEWASEVLGRALEHRDTYRRPAMEPAEAGEDEPSGRVMVTVHFVGGPWTGKTAEVDHVAAPVFAVGHEIGNHYWLDTKSDPPAYHWDGTGWEVAEESTDGGQA